MISAELAEKTPALLDLLAGALVVARPRLALVELTKIFLPTTSRAPGIHPSAVVDESANIHPSAHIGPWVCIEADVSVGENSILVSQITVQSKACIGSDCLLHPGTRIGPRVEIGDRVIIQSNACIGADGFSYATAQRSSAESVRSGEGLTASEKPPQQLRIESLGNVILEDDVEIGACTTIDLATLGETRIKRGTKIDNLVQIGHNNIIGEDSLVCAQVGIAGSCTIGDGVILAGQVGIADHLKIGDRSVLMAKTGVIQHIEAGSILFGYPSRPHKDALRAFANVSRLGEMKKELRALKKELADLKRASQANPDT